MYLIKKYNLDNFFFLNFLIAIIPLSIILGNMAININVILICFIGLFTFKKKVFLIEDKIYQILIWSFFLYLIIITFVNNLPLFSDNTLYKSNFLKSIFYIRFLLLFLIITKLIETNNFKLNYFFISSAFFSSLLALDIIIQVIFGTDLIGNKIYISKPSGFFGTENIAGGYLQKFILFFIFLIALRIKKNKNLFILILFILFFIPIILTGNRMPALIYFFIILIYFFFEKKFKELLYSLIASILLVFFLLKFPLTERFEIQLKTFHKSSFEIITKAPQLFYYNNDETINYGTGYLVHFNTGVQIWKEKKIFGHGLKSFQLNCQFGGNYTCNTHPHNYFIEMLVDVGLFGVAIMYLLIFIGISKFIKSYFYNFDIKNKLTLFPFFPILFFEFFPFRSTGSFFTTNNSVVIFLMLAIFLKYNNLINIYKK